MERLCGGDLCMSDRLVSVLNATSRSAAEETVELSRVPLLSSAGSREEASHASDEVSLPGDWVGARLHCRPAAAGRRAGHHGEHSGNDRGRRRRAAGRDNRGERRAERLRVRSGDGSRRLVHPHRAETRHVRNHRHHESVQAGIEDRAGLCRTIPDRELQGHARRAVHRAGAGRRQLAADRNAHVGGIDDGHDRAGAVPPAESAELPQLRGARAGRARVGQRHAETGDRRRARRDADQRVHRRRQLQERCPRRRCRRTGFEPRLAVSADRGPGVPGAHAELQGGARKSVEPRDQRRHQERHQPLVGRGIRLLPGQGARRERALRRAARRSEAAVRALPARPRDRRTHRQGSRPGIRILRGEPAGSREPRVRRHDAVSSEPGFPQGPRGHVRQPVQRKAVLRQDVGATEIRAFSRAQLRPAQRNRHPQLRPADQLRVGGERAQPGRLGAREMARPWLAMDERGYPHVSAIQLEPRAGEHRRHRAELHRRDEDRRARHDAGLHPDARVAARRLHALRAVEGSAHAQGGRRGQLPSIRSGEVLQRQSGVRIPPGRGVYLPVPGAIRRRQSGSQHGQPPGRVLHPGRLERGLEAHDQRWACAGTTSPTC